MVLVEQLAQTLARARLERATASILPSQALDKLSIQDGYRILSLSQRYLEQQPGWNLAGWKIGATGRKSQEQLGLSHPIWGPVYQASVKWHTSSSCTTELSISRDQIVRVETEYAFVIKQDIVPRKQAYSIDELLQQYCEPIIRPCVEVGATRVPKLVRGSLPLLIGDTGNGAVVFPHLPSQEAEFGAPPSWILVDGQEQARTDRYEEKPEVALKWFVDTAVNGEQVTVKQGHFVMTGATCGLVPITTPCLVKAYFPHSTLDPCEIRFVE